MIDKKKIMLGHQKFLDYLLNLGLFLSLEHP